MRSRPALVLALVAGAPRAEGTDRPIIAIVAHPSSSTNGDCGGDCELVEGSYVKWIESAGTMPVSACPHKLTPAPTPRDARIRDDHLLAHPAHPCPGP